MRRLIVLVLLTASLLPFNIIPTDTPASTRTLSFDLEHYGSSDFVIHASNTYNFSLTLPKYAIEGNNVTIKINDPSVYVHMYISFDYEDTRIEFGVDALVSSQGYFKAYLSVNGKQGSVNGTIEMNYMMAAVITINNTKYIYAWSSLSLVNELLGVTGVNASNEIHLRVNSTTSVYVDNIVLIPLSMTITLGAITLEDGTVIPLGVTIPIFDFTGRAAEETTYNMPPISAEIKVIPYNMFIGGLLLFVLIVIIIAASLKRR